MGGLRSGCLPFPGGCGGGSVRASRVRETKRLSEVNAPRTLDGTMAGCQDGNDRRVQTVRPNQLGPLSEEKSCKFPSHISEACQDDPMPHSYLIEVREARSRVRSALGSRARITEETPLPRSCLRLQVPEEGVNSRQAFRQIPVRVPHPDPDEPVHSEMVAGHDQRGLLFQQATC